MRYTRVSSISLPVRIDDLVNHMRTGFTASEMDSGALMESQRLAMTATREIEHYCDIALTRQTISFSAEAEGGDVIALPVGPLAPDAVVTVNGTEITDGIEGGRYPRLTLAADITGTVAITYEAGFGDTAASVPDDLRHAVMDQALGLHDWRGDSTNRPGLTPAAARICARHRRVSL